MKPNISKRKSIAQKLKQTTVLTALPMAAVIALTSSASATFVYPVDKWPIVGGIVNVIAGGINSVVDPIQNWLPFGKIYLGQGPFSTNGVHVLDGKTIHNPIFASGVSVGFWGASKFLSTQAQLSNLTINVYHPYGNGIRVYDNSTVDMSNITVNAKGPGNWLFGVRGLNVRGVNSTVTGDNLTFNGVKYGIIVQSDSIVGNFLGASGSVAKLSNVNVDAWYKGADVKGVPLFGGIFGRGNQPSLYLDNFNFNVKGGGLVTLYHVGAGVTARQGGKAFLNNGTINVEGKGNIGIELLCYISVNCPSSGIGAIGGALLGSNSYIEANNVVVTTSGKNIPGLSAWGTVLGGNPTIIGTNLNVSTNGQRSYGAYASGAMFRFLRANDALVQVDGITVATAGDLSYGAFAVSNGKVVLTGTEGGNSITTSGYQSYGAYARGESSKVTLNNMYVETTGDSAHGAAAKGRSFLGKIPFVGGLAQSFLGSSDATVVLNNSTIVAKGTNSHGLYGGPRTIARDLPIIGDLPLLAGFFEGWNIDLAAGGVFDLSGTSVSSEQGYGIYADKAVFGSQTDVTATNGSYITGKEGAFRVVSNKYSILGIGDNTLNLSLDSGSVLYGRGITNYPDPSIFGLNPFGILNWFAAKTTSNVSLKGNSTWYVNGNSNVTNLTLDNSTVAFVQNVYSDEYSINRDKRGLGNDGFTTLVVDNTFTSNNGTVVINAKLGNSSSPADLLYLTNGAASGSTTNVVVVNRGGLGDYTSGDGIKIIDVNGNNTDATFTLKGDYSRNGTQYVAAGAYAYSMYKNGVTAATANNGNYYLRNVDPNNTANVMYQPGVGVYEALPQVLQQMNTLSSLQQRTGNRTWVGVQDPKPFKKGALATSEPENVIDGRGFWARVEGSTGEFNANKTSSKMNYDLDQIKVQLGVDFLLSETENGSWIAGLFGQYGHGKSDVKSYYGNGEVKADSYGFGGTLTWYGTNDWYVDAQAQVNWFEADLKSKTAGVKLKNDVDGFGYAVSVEGGKKFTLNHEWSMTPQAQLVWNSIDFDDFNDVWGANVKAKDGDSLLGRVGLSFDRETQWTGEDGKAQRLKLYAIGNLYYEFLDDGTKVSVAGINFKHSNDQFWGGVGAGLTYNWADDMYSIYANIDARSSFDDFGDTYILGGAVGFKVKF